MIDPEAPVVAFHPVAIAGPLVIRMAQPSTKDDFAGVRFGPPVENQRAHISAPSREFCQRYLLESDPVTLYLRCGRVFTLTLPRDLPEGNLACECGDPDCLIVEYTGE